MRAGDFDRGGVREPGNLVLQLRQWLAVHRQLHRPPRVTLLRELCAGLPKGVARGSLGLPRALEAQVTGARARTAAAAAPGDAGASADEVLLKKLSKLSESLAPGELSASLDVSLLRVSLESADVGDGEGDGDEEEDGDVSASQRWAARRRRAIQRATVKKELMRRAVLMPRENYDDSDEGGFRRSSSDGVWLPAPKPRARTPAASATAGGAEGGEAGGVGERVFLSAVELGESWRLMCQKEEASGKRATLHRPLSGPELEALFRKYGEKRGGLVVIDVLDFSELVTGARDSAGDAASEAGKRGGGGERTLSGGPRSSERKLGTQRFSRHRAGRDSPPQLSLTGLEPRRACTGPSRSSTSSTATGTMRRCGTACCSPGPGTYSSLAPPSACSRRPRGGADPVRSPAPSTPSSAGTTTT